MDGAFHGRTMMTMAMTTSKTGYRSGYQPLPAGVFVAPFPRPFEWGVDEQTAVERSLRSLERLLAAQTAPSETAAIVIEPVLGEGGYLPAPAAYLQGVREICDTTGILFVADEVQSGFARTGRMFAVEHADVVPDIIVMAKGIASGFPIAGIGASAGLMEQWPQGAHGGTYGGNPIGCAAALATIDVIEQEHLADNARDRGRQLMEALAKLQAENAGIGDVRGLGLMVGTELIDPDGGPAAARTAAIMRHCLDEGNVIFMNCGTGSNVLRWMPPLIVSAEEIDRGIAAFAAALKATA
jgi:4-aminobutyrate aminotransferase